MQAKLIAEFMGTLWLVLGGCGSAVLAAAFPQVGIGLLGVSLAFGLTVLTAAYALARFQAGTSIRLYRSASGPAVAFLLVNYCLTSLRKYSAQLQARPFSTRLPAAPPHSVWHPDLQRTVSVPIRPVSTRCSQVQ